MSNDNLKSIKHGYMIIQWMWLIGFQKNSDHRLGEVCAWNQSPWTMQRDDWKELFALEVLVQMWCFNHFLIYFVVVLKILKTKWVKPKRCMVTGHFLVEQPRQSNWDLWILNWIQIELRPNRRNRGVGTGFRRSGNGGGRADLWPCVEAEIAETVPDRRQEREQPAAISHFWARTHFLLKEQLLLGRRRRRTRMLAPSDCCGRRIATAVSWKTFDSHMSSAASLDQAE